MIAVALLALVACAVAQDTTTAAGAATTAASKCTQEEITKAAEAALKCANDFTTCSKDADNAKKCTCFKTSITCFKGVKVCVDVPSPAPTTADDKKKAIAACVTASGCTDAECEAIINSSSGLVASVSVVLALVAARLF